MARSIYVPQVGGFVEFSDTATDAEIVSALNARFAPSPAPAAQPTEAPSEPDESGILGRAAYGFATGFTDIPSGIAALLMPAEEVEKTSAGQFSEGARKYLQETFGIDPTKDPTSAQQAAEILGNVGSFLVPGAGAAKAAVLAGKGARVLSAAGAAQRVAKIAGTTTAAAQGVALGASGRERTIREQLASGMDISPDEQLAAQRLSGFIGAAEAAPIGRFFGPLTTLLSKVPASKAPIVEQILKSRLASLTKAGVAEGAQEAASGIANDLVEYGVYNPEVEIGQDLLSNAGSGAFAGSFIEGVIQLAAGRKLRPYRQLQADLAKEKQQNIVDYRRGTIANAAERLRQFNVEGPVEIAQEEIDNEPIFTIKTKGGNVVGSLPDFESANQAVDLYRKKTGANVRILEPVKGPEIFPVKIAGQSFNSMDDVVAAQTGLRDRFTATNEFLADPASIQRNATLKGLNPEFYKKKVEADVVDLAKDLEQFDNFVRIAAPTPIAPEPAADIEKVNILRGPASRGEALPSKVKIQETLKPIAYDAPRFNEQTKTVTRESGESNIIDFGGRKIVIKNVNGVNVPFYLSSGLGGKANVPAGKWYPFFGIGKDGWINKGSQEQIANFYGSPELRAAAAELDTEIGDIRQDNTAPKVGLTGRHIDEINAGLSPTENQTPDTETAFDRNAQDILGRIKTSRPPVQAVSAVEAPAPIGAVEPAPAAPVGGIGAIVEPEIAPTPFEEPLASKTGPTPVPVEPTAQAEPETAGQKAVGPLPSIPRVVTPKEAIAAVVAPREYTPEQKAYNDEIYKQLETRLNSIATQGTKLDIKEMIDTLPGYLIRGNVRKTGEPNGIATIVELSKGILDPDKTVDQNVKALLDVLNHEIIHVVRNQLRPVEWTALSKAVANTKVPGKKYTYLDKAEAVYAPNGKPISEEYANPDSIIEEAVAEMYKDWVRDGLAPPQTRGPFNRITEFFRRIFRVLKSTAYEDAFKRIESGEVRGREISDTGVPSRLYSASPLGAPYNPLKSQSNWEKTGSPPAGISSVNLTGGSPFRISQRRPTSVGSEGESVRTNLLINSDAMKQTPKAYLHNIDILNSYPNMPVIEGEDPEQTLRRFKDHVIENLLWLHDTMEPAIRKRAKNWYDGARVITTALAKKYDLPDTTVAAVLAGLSPQKDWFQNVSLAERLIDIVVTKRNEPFSDSMMEALRNTESMNKYSHLFGYLEGKTLQEISEFNPEEFLARNGNRIGEADFSAEQAEKISNGLKDYGEAIFVRFYDEANNPREYNIITPEGGTGGTALTKAGKASKVAWGSFGEIGKGIDAIRDGSKENIDAILGDKHKIRNFYNNILSPNSQDGSVTIDTHAVAAALLRALSGGSDEVHHNFGTSVPKVIRKTSNSDKTGVQGLYAFYADAYREAAKRRGILPREMQSITWEAVRGLYKPTFKAQAKNVDLIDQVWNKYKQGKITANAARKQILDLADPGAISINSPFWKDTPGNIVYAGGGPSINTAGVVGLGIRQAAGKPVGGRTVGNAGVSKPSGVKFSAAPLPAYIETKNDTLFAKHDNVPFVRMIFDFLFKPNTGSKFITTTSGQTVEIGKWTQFGLASRAALVDRNAAVTYLEKLLNQQTTGNFERMTADYSATAAMAWRNRSSHLTAAMIRMGKLDVEFARPGDIQSATMKVSEDTDSLMNVVKVLMQPGPTDSRTNEQKDKREVFKSYASAMRSRSIKARGLSVPGQLDDTYVNTIIPFTEQNYPEVVEAYKMYQRFNKKLLESAVKAGLIKQADLNNLTRDMDYYGFYHEVYDTAMVPGLSTKTASQFKLRPYRGSEFGNLVNDPVFVMIQNAQFWVDSIAKNLATVKAFEVTRQMGQSRLLQTGEEPREDLGETQQVMFYKDSGVQKRFAVKDPLLVTALGSDDRIDMGRFFKMMGLPTQWIRESVTRDPGFMVANLLRDTLSSWITSGEDITPFLGTLRGFKSALKKESSFQSLMGRGVVGSYDLAMLPPADLAKKIGRIATPKNVHIVPNLEAGIGAATALWDRLGALSEASDAATRIAVYDAAINQGMSEAEAAFRAIEIMDFSRRGGSGLMSVLTKLIPFLNARIQGLDVLWQAGKAGARFATGKSVGEKDANLGKKFLVRGGMLAALSIVLEMWNSDDEDYENLDDYVKTGNLLIPLKGLGMKGEFLAIPKPFEAGLLFSTFPQQFYKSMSGDASTRENLNLFTTEFGATFGVNFVPQVALPLAEAWWNIDFYTGLPLISEGKARLAPELQYNTGTSTLSMLLGKVPVKYNLTTGKFEGVSPIIIENLIEGYSGPIGSMIVDGVGVGMDMFNIGPERMPTDLTKLPVVRRVFIDAEKKNPKVVTQAYELFQIADEANRTFSRLKQIGDVEAVKDYVEENRDILTYRKYIFKMTDGLNKLNARERQIETDATMTEDEKREAMRKLREVRINIASKVGEINAVLGR